MLGRKPPNGRLSPHAYWDLLGIMSLTLAGLGLNGTKDGAHCTLLLITSCTRWRYRGTVVAHRTITQWLVDSGKGTKPS